LVGTSRRLGQNTQHCTCSPLRHRWPQAHLSLLDTPSMWMQIWRRLRQRRCQARSRYTRHCPPLPFHFPATQLAHGPPFGPCAMAKTTSVYHSKHTHTHIQTQTHTRVHTHTHTHTLSPKCPGLHVHAVAAVLPAGEFELAAQAVQSASPLPALNLPASQSMQSPQGTACARVKKQLTQTEARAVNKQG